MDQPIKHEKFPANNLIFSKIYPQQNECKNNLNYTKEAECYTVLASYGNRIPYEYVVSNRTHICFYY